MQTIALVNQKGGCGKSTIAIHIAAAFALAGEDTLLIDLDPQRSACKWAQRRNRPSPAVEPVTPDRLKRVHEHAQQIETGMLICDTAAHIQATALEVCRLADLVVVPCQASIMDIESMERTAELLKQVQSPAVALLTRVPPTGSVADEAETAIASYLGIPVCPVRIGERVAYRACMIPGLVVQEHEPHGKAAEEVERLHAWLVDLITAGKQDRSWQNAPAASARGSKDSEPQPARPRWLRPWKKS